MTEILTCVLCGRRGVANFVRTAPDPSNPEAGHGARCANRKACQQRVDAARPDEQAAVEKTASQFAGDDSEERFASAGSVAGLAREVEALRTAVVGLRGLPAQVDDVTRVVQELAERVAALATRPRKVVSPSWLVLPEDLAAAQEVLADLVGWLGEVYLRYAGAAKALPECWLWHPDVVEELLWLMHSWQAAYREPNASVALAGDWHDRYRPGVVGRISKSAGNCSLEKHQPKPGRTLPSGPVVPVSEAMQPIAEWWATRRGETAPHPTEEQVQSTRRPWGGDLR